jgi:hypothetical protein
MHLSWSDVISKRRTSLICIAALAGLASGCGSSTPVGFCAAPRSFSVIVTVRDSISGQGAADGAIGTLVGGSVDDTLFQVDSLTLEGGDATGTFSVHIDHPGYLTWSASDVHVTQRGPCGNVIPVQLSAKLQPATP